MVTQTVALLLQIAALLAALAALGLFVWSLARFIYSDLLLSGSSWPVMPLIQVKAALGQSIAVRGADVDLSVRLAHGDPVQLPATTFQADVTL
jgi:hypothetical protein